MPPPCCVGYFYMSSAKSDTGSDYVYFVYKSQSGRYFIDAATLGPWWERLESGERLTFRVLANDYAYDKNKERQFPRKDCWRGIHSKATDTIGAPLETMGKSREMHHLSAIFPDADLNSERIGM